MGTSRRFQRTPSVIRVLVPTFDLPLGSPGYQLVLVTPTISKVPVLACWADWHSGLRRGLRTKGSLARVVTATQFVVALSKSHLPTV